MAATASSSFTCDVFLSFRGTNTRKNFTDHLYFALERAGITTFRDDNKLERGEAIPSQLLSAIEGSKFSIIVFSKDYADSSWCLDELVKIVECRRTVKQHVLPIFYDVEPTDVRHQKGSFEQAFSKHEKRYLSNKDKVIRWRTALKEVANLSGWDLKSTDGYEAKFIDQIVKDVSKKLNDTYLHVAFYPVGIESRVKDITSLLRVGANDVHMLGIWGIGGVGKTTLSKAIYNKLFHSFEYRSYLPNIRETSKNFDGLVRLQEQLLSDILKTSEIKVNNVDRGIYMIQKRLYGRRVLIVLDDVDQLEQLNAIARSRVWFGPGSRIIITTRDEHMLRVLQVDEVYKAKELSEKESLELFGWHAFRNDYPTEEHMKLSSSVVAYSGGLPLALEVLGCFLSTKNMDEWKNTLEKLKSIPNGEIQKKLRISYDALSDNSEKAIFLDISCFFIGMDKDYVTQILNACDFYTEIGIRVLIQRCLLSVDEQNKLIMHDLLRDMGREIVREEWPDLDEPGKRSRLWLHEDAHRVLAGENQGSIAVEGLTLKLPRLNKETFSTKTFIEMNRLRLLHLDHVHLTGDYEHLSKNLRWLRWHRFSEKFFPNNFHSRNLVVLDLRYSNLTQIWKNSKQLFEKLKFLNLSHSHRLVQISNFAGLPNLEKLILKDCTSLFEFHQSIGDLNNLVFVNLKDCKSLQSLPKSFYRLKSLQTLILSGCSRLDNLAEELGEMESLTTFLADNTAIRQVPCTIVRLKKLKYLSLCGCRGPPSKSLFSLFCSWIFPRKSPKSVSLLPASLQGLNSLRELDLSHCNLTDDAIPKDLGSLCALQSLNLENNHFHSLPSSLGGLSKLQDLWLDNCTNLQSIPDLPPNLWNLNAKNCTTLERMPSLGGLSELQNLCLNNCTNLQSIPDLPPNLWYLEAENCTTLERMPSLGGLSELCCLYLNNCTNLQSIPDLPPNLWDLEVENCTTLERMPSLGGLSELSNLYLNNCTNLQSIPDLPPNLWDLDAENCTTLERMSSLGGLSELSCLYLNNCTNLQSIPDLPPNLWHLGAENCKALERMPDVKNIRLSSLHLRNCNKLAEILGLDKLLKCGASVDLTQCSNLTKNFKKSILQEWTSGGFGSICLPGNEIPDWFTYTAEGHSICFEVPRINDDRNIQRISVCVVCNVYSSFDNCRVEYSKEFPCISVINKTKPTLTFHLRQSEIGFFDWMYGGNLFSTFEDHIWQFQHRKFNFNESGFNLVAGDEVEVKAYFGPRINVKKIGVCLRYDDGDASIDQVAIESKIGLGDDEVELSHSCFDDERGAKRLRCQHNTDDKVESNHSCFVDNREAKRLRYDYSAEMMIDDN